jgi:predicted DNA-binding transcriptional regulator AlpA
MRRNPRKPENHDAQPLPHLLDEFDVARITRLSVGTIRKWRFCGKGPKHLKLGTCVRYRPEDISSWLESAAANEAAKAAKL